MRPIATVTEMVTAVKHELEMRCKARPACGLHARLCNACKTQGLLDKSSLNLYQMLAVVGGVNARIHVAILSSAVECQRTNWRWGMPIFADWRQKSFTIATYLERSRKGGHIDHGHPHTPTSWEFGERKNRSSTLWYDTIRYDTIQFFKCTQMLTRTRWHA